jgi:DNA-binding NarL/FixJ family response regulator
MAQTTLSILIADDQPEVRSAMRLVIEQLVGYRIAAEASDAGELLVAAKDLAPDVVLLDWELPTGEAKRSAPLLAIRAIAPSTRIVAMSARHGARTKALDAGADAFVSKCEPPRRLIEVLDGLW